MNVKILSAVAALAFAMFAAASVVPVPSAEAQSTSSSSVVAEAETWIGVPYVYGGASRSGVDCSGLTQQVLAAFGVSLPHSAAGQYGYGVPGSGAAGDLVFADFTGSGVSHVGIATGDGYMINAPYPGTTVRTDPIPTENVVGYKSVV